MTGGHTMASETKVILALLSQQIGRAKTIKEAYTLVVQAANIEGFQLPSYEEFQKELEELQRQ